MKLRTPTIVLFDMDGTTVRHVSPKLLGALEFLDDLSYKAIRLLRRREINPAAVDNSRRPRLLVHRAIHFMRRKPVEQIVQPCPGVIDVLDVLKQAGIPMALVSNGLGKGYGHDILQKFDLEKYFEATIFREDITRSKPHPDPILRVLDAMRRRPGADDVVWYIGDRHKDVIAAIAARKHLPCQIEPLSYGLHAAIAILERHIGADHIIVNYHEFAERLREMFQRPMNSTAGS